MISDTLQHQNDPGCPIVRGVPMMSSFP